MFTHAATLFVFRYRYSYFFHLAGLQGYKVSLLWHVVRVAIRRNMFYNSLQGTGILFRDTNTNMEKILAKKQQG
jgi:hypothetical protein